MNTSDEFITVPVLQDFRQDKIIGELRVLKSALPPVSGFCFSLGIKALDMTGITPGAIPTAQYTGPYELVCVSIVNDQGYGDYLRQVGVIK